MITRNQAFALFVSATLLCGAAAQAAGPITPVDFGIEASTDKVLMPSSSIGSVVLTCDTCNARSYRLTSGTLYKIGNSSASFAEFAANVRGAPARNLMVFVKPDKTVTRMTVSIAAAK
ncbi:MAG: hypothetical protein WDO68_12650 [Gammaproteobacteria bacterium]